MPPHSDLSSLDRFQNYLLVTARANVEPYGGAGIDINDLVQLTLLKAHQNRAQFRGSTDAELARWLRSILVNQLTDHLRKAGRELDEQAFARRLEQSSARFGQMLAAEQSSPSQRVVWNEKLDQLAEALMQLPADQQRAIELRHLQAMSLADIATTMNRSTSSVAGLLQRGLTSLRDLARHAADEP